VASTAVTISNDNRSMDFFVMGYIQLLIASSYLKLMKAIKPINPSTEIGFQQFDLIVEG
jgi:hypothetical protein